MKYSAKTKPGMGDPYWYEWSVGQQYIIDMLNSDNNIKFVTKIAGGISYKKKYSRIIVGKTGSCIKRMDNLW